jgi:two-component system response regulator
VEPGTVQQAILLVEDNEDDLDLTLRAFRKSHLANPIVVARDGVEALDYLFGTGDHDGRDAREVPRLILLDLKLPKIDGLEVLRRLRSDPRTRLAPVVILTSSDEDRDRAEGYGLGANSYIRKPVDFGAFVKAVEQLGVYWLLLNQAPPEPA